LLLLLLTDLEGDTEGNCMAVAIIGGSHCESPERS
jgi:hypothetical protein